MDPAELYDRVAARLPRDFEVEAEALTRAVFSALAERLTAEEAAEIGAELPEELGDLLIEASGDGALERDEFFESLAARLDIDDSDAEIGATAVMRVLREALEPVMAIEQVMETLPPDLAQLMTR